MDHNVIAARDTPVLLNFFKVLGSTSKDVFPLNKSCRGEGPGNKNQGFAMVWIATIHSELMVCVCGLDVQVSTNKPSLVQTLVLREVTSSANQDAVNFMVATHKWKSIQCMQILSIPNDCSAYLLHSYLF